MRILHINNIDKRETFTVKHFRFVLKMAGHSPGSTLKELLCIKCSNYAVSISISTYAVDLLGHVRGHMIIETSTEMSLEG